VLFVKERWGGSWCVRERVIEREEASDRKRGRATERESERENSLFLSLGREFSL